MENNLTINRREFMAAAGAAVAGAALGPAMSLAQDAAPNAADEWFDRPMRWMQLVLVENDPAGQYDPEFWLDLFARVHADAACLSAGGCVAYYPTNIEYHHRSAWMKRGPIRSASWSRVAASWEWWSSRGPTRIRSATMRPKAHPEWVAVDAQGNKRRHWADARALGHLRAGAVQLRVHDRSDQGDRPQIQGGRRLLQPLARAAGCATASRAGRSSSSSAAWNCPRTTQTRRMPAYRNWLEWSNGRLFELWRLWDGEIRKINPAARYIANSGGGSMTTLDMKTIGELAPTLFADRQSAPRADAAVGQRQKRQGIPRHVRPQADRRHRQHRHRRRASLEGFGQDRSRDCASGWPTASPTDCGRGSPSSRHASTTSAGLPVVEKLTTGTGGTRRYLRNEENLARVAMVYSQQTGTYYGGEQKHRTRGGPRAGHVPGAGRGAHSVRDGARPDARSGSNRPVQAADPAEHRRPFRCPVRAAPRNTSSAAEACSRPSRPPSTTSGANAGKNFGLADLFGVSYAGKVERDIKNALHAHRGADRGIRSCAGWRMRGGSSIRCSGWT